MYNMEGRFNTPWEPWVAAKFQRHHWTTTMRLNHTSEPIVLCNALRLVGCNNAFLCTILHDLHKPPPQKKELVFNFGPAGGGLSRDSYFLGWFLFSFLPMTLTHQRSRWRSCPLTRLFPCLMLSRVFSKWWLQGPRHCLCRILSATSQLQSANLPSLPISVSGWCTKRRGMQLWCSPCLA